MWLLFGVFSRNNLLLLFFFLECYGLYFNNKKIPKEITIPIINTDGLIRDKPGKNNNNNNNNNNNKINK